MMKRNEIDFLCARTCKIRPNRNLPVFTDVNSVKGMKIQLELQVVLESIM